MPIALPRRLAGTLTALLIAAFAVIHVAAPAMAQTSVKQIRLTEAQVKGYIAAQKPMTAITDKMQGATDKPDPKIQAQLEAIAKAHGFKDFAEYDAVAANIGMVMANIDPQTKEFTDLPTTLKQEIAEVQADKSMPAEEKKQMLEELGTALKNAKPIENRGNVDLVKKYYDQIDALLQ
jgi:hypothetical protein